MMQQFLSIKAQYPDALLLFRCGDFYETYCEDAVKASKILNITLTHRNNGNNATNQEMAGFPFHALDTYLPKLVREGLRVAICDQLEDPKLTKKLVKRGVTELVTPAVSYSETTLSRKENTWVACLTFDKQNYGIAFLDISTGEFLAAEGNRDYIDKLLTNFSPKEVLFLRGKKNEFIQLFGNRFFTFELEDWMLSPDTARERLQKQWQLTSFKGLGVDRMPNGIIAAGAILFYLDATQHLFTAHIQHLARIEEDKYVWLDQFTVRNLELFNNPDEQSRSLYSIIDRTASPMGARMLHRWLTLPLKQLKPIKNRQTVVEYFFHHTDQRNLVREQIKLIGDMERLAGKVATGRITPREMIQLANALTALARVQDMCLVADNNSYLHLLGEQIDLCEQACTRILHDIQPNPPAIQGKPNIIAQGVNPQLDQLRDIHSNGKQYLLDIQKREILQTGIQSLKIGYNNVFGYYLEVRNTYKDLVPENWIRKQTLVNAERYITEELKHYEETILSAEEKIQIIENQLYAELIQMLTGYLMHLQNDARIVAQIDCLSAFAAIAVENHYVCPDVNDSLTIDIRGGRHPVIEQQMSAGESYIPNDVLLDNNQQQIIILTGPNMAGKSALLRQTALIVLLAQIGSFVPADSAKIGVVDKIFTRVGANDNISMGESTFMVEMNEAASILNNLSQRSLVLFDELGRGTSTYDGISIAWAIVEYIHNHPGKAKTLFATHYHELNDMEQNYDRIYNYNVSVQELNGKIIFLRKLMKGGSEHSFGIHVAKIAGMPESIILRSNDILRNLEQKNPSTSTSAPTSAVVKNQTAHENTNMQLSFFQLDDPVLEQIREELTHIDINNLTPIQALNKLHDIKQLVGG